MKATDDDLRDALVGERRADRAGCPSSEALARAAEAGADEALQDHLGRCADCAFEYRLAASLKPWAEGAAASLAPRPATRSASRALPVALAASLAACVGLLAVALAQRQQGQQLEARLGDAERRQEEAARRVQAEAAERGLRPPETGVFTGPHANVPVVDLFPADAARGSGEGVPTVDLSGSPLAVLILNVRRPEAGGTYALEIDDAAGRRVWAADRIPATGEAVTLGVPSHVLAGNAYRIRLYRVRGNDRTPIESYTFRVRRSPAGSPP
jgi:hypothetical protein